MWCPVCGSDMRSRSLLPQFRFKPYDVCPDCGAKYRFDARTRRRALIMVVLALLQLALSTAGLRLGFPWGLAAFFGGVGLLVYVGYTLSKMSFVQYRD